MYTKKEAGHHSGEAGEPAGKSTYLDLILARILRPRKPCRCLPEAWSTIGDLISATRELQSDLTDYQHKLDIAIARLGELEASLWRRRRRSA